MAIALLVFAAIAFFELAAARWGYDSRDLTRSERY